MKGFAIALVVSVAVFMLLAWTGRSLNKPYTPPTHAQLLERVCEEDLRAVRYDAAQGDKDAAQLHAALAALACRRGA